MSTETPPWQPSIDGLDLEHVGIMSGGAIEKAAIATIRSLDAEGLLGARHALTCQLIVELARAVGRGLAFGKVTVATATLARQLLDAIDSLPHPPDVDPAADEFERLTRQLAGL